MKERPILFSAPMVRALLDGSKTQTRRVAKVPADATDVRYWAPPSGRSQAGWADPGVNYWTPDPSGCTLSNHLDACPYGQRGDRLWVRETWMPDPPIDDSWASTQWNGCGRMISEVPERFRHPRFCNYNADWLHGAITWRPSIHMPRWASRITLEVTEVRVERLQAISEADAKAEGVSMPDGTPTPPDFWSYAQEYGHLWDRINGAGAWTANPWVWVVEFRRL